jgi:anti-anti-sigma factor
LSITEGGVPRVPAFRVAVEHDRAFVRVCPVGELDVDTVQHVAAEIERLCDAGFAHIVLYLRPTTFLDSSGLHLVLDEQVASSRDGWDFDVIAGSPQVQRAFEISGILSCVRFLDPVPEAGPLLPAARAVRRSDQGDSGPLSQSPDAYGLDG